MEKTIKFATKEPYDEVRGYKQIETIRSQLMVACVRHAVEGKSGHIKDRIRDASDASGIPRTFIESEVDRMK